MLQAHAKLAKERESRLDFEADVKRFNTLLQLEVKEIVALVQTQVRF